MVLQPVQGLVIHLGGLQQGFGGDAADVQAGAAQRGALFNAGDLQAQLRRADGANITAGAGTDHDNVEILCHFSAPLRWFQEDAQAS
jgi:hypothetical protein